MKKSIYKIIIAPTIAALLLILITYYSVGVVERSSAEDVADTRIDQIISCIDENYNNFEIFKNQLKSEYEAKAQSFSLIMSQTPKALTEDMAIEELRLTIGADEVSIVNGNGKITFSTSSDMEGKRISDEFQYISGEKNFSKTLITQIDDKYFFEVAVSQRNSSGLILLKFVNTSLNNMLNYSGIATVTSDYPMMQYGITAIVDIPTHKYLSHTTSVLAGTVCTIPPERFSHDKGSVFYRVYGSASLVRYKKYDDKIILGILPKSEIYTGRNSTTGWLSLMTIVTLSATLLAIRQYKIENK